VSDDDDFSDDTDEFGHRYSAAGVRIVAIRDESIRLGQFLKFADLVDYGSDVRPLMMAGEVRVNGEIETRRGRQLAKGDIVTLGEEQVQVG
jgi:ribosome-associated protein